MTENKLIQIGEIVERYDVPQATLYRWMKAHPNLKMPDPNSALGHPFPQPVGRLDRKGLWDANEVEEWWAANCTVVGRHVVEDPTIIMDFERFDRAWKNRRIAHEKNEETGEQALVEDDIKLLIKGFDMHGDDQVKVRFRTASDAVLFRLKY